MKKVIVMSVRPEWLAKILNGEKTVEIRTRVPNDFVGEIHLACTKGKERLLEVLKGHYDDFYGQPMDFDKPVFIKIDNTLWGGFKNNHILNGKVVAKFDYDYKNVERISYDTIEDYAGDMEDVCIKEIAYERIVNNACLDYEQMSKYSKCKPLFAITLKNLVAFNKPIELGKYYIDTTLGESTKIFSVTKPNGIYHHMVKPLTRCPQSYQFAYVEEE